MRVFIRAVLKFLREADIFLFVLSLTSTIYGTILISSVIKNSNTGGREIYIQIGAIVIGIVLFVVFSYLDIDIIADKSRILLLFSILFISTLYFWGVGGEEVGNKNWLLLFDISIQPAEVVKVTFIIIIAKMIANHMERKTLNMSSIMDLSAIISISRYENTTKSTIPITIAPIWT